MIKYRTVTTKEPYTVCDKCKQILQNTKNKEFGDYVESNTKYVEISVIHNMERTLFNSWLGFREERRPIERIRNVQLCYDCIEKFEKWLDEE